MRDPYVYDNGTLKNKLGIRDYQELRKAEADICFLFLIDTQFIEYLPFNEQMLSRIHYLIFRGIFDWAGDYRTVPIVKEEAVFPGYSVPYSDFNQIEADLKKRFHILNSIQWDLSDLDGLCFRFAREMALLWRVHPFRDGNTRTFLCFASFYAQAHGFPFDVTYFEPMLDRVLDENGRIVRYSIRDRFVYACLDEKDCPEVQYLARAFSGAIKSYQSANSVQVPLKR